MEFVWPESVERAYNLRENFLQGQRARAVAVRRKGMEKLGELGRRFHGFEPRSQRYSSEVIFIT